MPIQDPIKLALIILALLAVVTWMRWTRRN